MNQAGHSKLDYLYASRDRLVIFDADGTLIDAFDAIKTTFAQHDMDIGDLERFQKRRKLLKYLGGLREFPKNLRQQFGKQSRKKLIDTLTEIYRTEAQMYTGMARLLRQLVETPDMRVGIVTRNITREPVETIHQLLKRHGIDGDALDFLSCITLREDKLSQFKTVRMLFDINPARAYVCGDEYRDYVAANNAGMRPLIASYGFEDHDRLCKHFGIPEEVLARTPAELSARLCHALDLQPALS